MTEQIAIHSEPAWQDRANFLIFADLADHDMPGRMEQLWAQQMDRDEFVLCCIPFFTYGLALGDRVKTSPRGGREYVISERLHSSGRITYRCWFGDLAPATRDKARLDAVVLCQREGWLFEWSSTNLLAVDIPSALQQSRFATAFAPLLAQGVTYERG